MRRRSTCVALGVAMLLPIVACGSGLHHDDAAGVDHDGGHADVASVDRDSGPAGGEETGVTPDAAADSDGSDAGPHHRIFVTTETHRAGFSGGIAGADEMCQTEAASLGGTFRAWLAANGENPAARFADGSYWLVGEPAVLVAETRAVLASGGAIRSGIIRGADGSPVTDGCVWTGFLSTDDCQDWTLNPVGPVGSVGRTGASDAAWTNDGTTKCVNFCRLYCIEN